MDEIIKKKEGFEGQKAIVIPRQILNSRCARNNIIGTMYITDIGYYPRAQHHFRERAGGAEQHILIYCHDGKGKICFHKREYTLAAGEYCVIPIKAPHSYAADPVNPWTIYWVHFKGGIADYIVGEMISQDRLKGFIRYDRQCIDLFNEIYDRLESGYASNALLHANMCLWNLIASFLYNDDYGSQDALTEKSVTDKAIDYMKCNVSKDLSLAEIAREARLSHSHFSFVFKRKTGFTPIQYFNHLKVQKACQFLIFTSMRIKQIALEVGIEDQYYFSRMFSKLMGMSPNQYRELRAL
ncbi:MAG TPA: AraC family transcriptional regulator [Bacteroidales bacterium]|nr:AraC family transcriptional regulator [Bacteroidales bacterium]HRZ22185.1 AraC family transcriptional regulator [Bacteroidales bacterium]